MLVQGLEFAVSSFEMSEIIGPTHKEMARLSWPARLVT